MQDWTQKKPIGSDVSVTGLSKGDVEFGHGVWIGNSVIILSGVKKSERRSHRCGQPGHYLGY